MKRDYSGCYSFPFPDGPTDNSRFLLSDGYSIFSISDCLLSSLELMSILTIISIQKKVHFYFSSKSVSYFVTTEIISWIVCYLIRRQSYTEVDDCLCNILSAANFSHKCRSSNQTNLSWRCYTFLLVSNSCAASSKLGSNQMSAPLSVLFI